MANITPEYVIEYITKNDKIIENLKNKIISLENEKAVVAERNKNILFRLNAAERQLYDLNNTLMNHFAYKNRTYETINHPVNQAPAVNPVPAINPPATNPFNVPTQFPPNGPAPPFTFNTKL